MTELADERRVAHRTGKKRVERTQPWRRKLSGRSGATVSFPAGTYSDDTQLRLATARAIRSDGSFDVAAFAKVELTAWASYAVGAGIGSREAAANLARTSATWYSNLFKTRRADYVNAGGNGAAMRIQPHVWAAAKPLDFAPLLRHVVRNSICTHGHPRGIVGACLHALTLAVAINYGQPPRLRDLLSLADELEKLDRVISDDKDLGLFWLGPWEERLGSIPAQAISGVLDEVRTDINKITKLPDRSPSEAYHLAVKEIQADVPSSRGSGTKTAILAAFLGDQFKELGPDEALVVAANEYGSDTDSIATMAGAILGACTSEDCPNPIQDRTYIIRSAARLADVAEGQSETNFGYPDLRSWKPARAAVDAIGLSDDGPVLKGIGRLNALEEEVIPDGEFELRWFKLEFGQTILARVRQNPRKVERASTHVVPERRISRGSSTPPPPSRTNLPDLFSNGQPTAEPPDNSGKFLSGTLNECLQRAINSGFDARVVGELLLAQATPQREDFLERTIALAATIITAYEARQRRRKS